MYLYSHVFASHHHVQDEDATAEPPTAPDRRHFTQVHPSAVMLFTSGLTRFFPSTPCTTLVHILTPNFGSQIRGWFTSWTPTTTK